MHHIQLPAWLLLTALLAILRKECRSENTDWVWNSDEVGLANRVTSVWRGWSRHQRQERKVVSVMTRLYRCCV